MIERPVTARFLVVLCAAGFVFRVLVASLTPVPSEDGANYLWMAEKFAAGEPGQALSEVFPPLLPMMIAPFVWIGLDPFRAGQLVCVVCGTWALVPIVRATVVLIPAGGICAGCLLVFAPLSVRYAGQVYTEPCFHLFGAFALYHGLRGRWYACGALSGLAFWLRPEAVLIPLAFAAVRPRSAWRAILPLAAAVALLALWRGATGNGFDPVPKLTFNLERAPIDNAVAQGTGWFVLRFLGHLIQIPWLWIEAFSLTGVLALIGLFRARRREFAPLYLMLAAAVAVICLFLPRRRFLVGWIFAVAPLAVVGLRALPERGRLPVLIMVVFVSALSSFAGSTPDRYGERVVGEFVGSQLQPGEQVTGDMTRVIYFSGRRPLPPRHFSVEELLSMARAPGVRFVVLGSKRDTAEPVQSALALEFETIAMPADVRRWAEERGITVLRRR